MKAASVAVLLIARGSGLLLGQGAQEAKPSVAVHGFLLGILTGRTTGGTRSGTDEGDFALGESRLRLDLLAASASGEALLVAKGDLTYDALAGQAAVDLREAYAGYTRSGLDVRLGRQIVTWGVGDLFFITDVFPKDWESYFGGRPAEYLKLGVDGVRVRLSTAALSAEVAVVPFFAPDVLPSPDRFGLADPLADVPNHLETKPDASYSSTELALRLQRHVAGFDLALAAYRGFSRTPGVVLDDPSAPTTATRVYPRLTVYGLSAQRNAWDGVFSLEIGTYRTASASDAERGGLPRAQWRLLVGYQRPLWKDSTLGLQLYGERDDDSGAVEGKERVRRVASLRLTQLLGYDAIRLSLFTAWSTSDEDGFLRPEVTYKVSDELGVTVGSNVFFGASETTFFGRLRRGDNAFLSARYDF